MAEYLSPGVYVEEVDAGPKPIQGVGTSTAGAVGVTAKGPTSGKPELVTSFAEFQRKFGGIYDVPDAAIVQRWNDADGGYWWRFPLSVQGFFENGGQRLYVKRVSSKSAVAAKAELCAGLVARLTKDVPKDGKTIWLEHLIGIEKGARLWLVSGGSTLHGPYEVTAYDPATHQVSLGGVAGAPFGGVPVPFQKGVDFAELAARDAAKKTLEFTARDKGQWGNGMHVHVRPVVGPTLALLADATEGPAVSTTTSADAVATDAVVDADAAAGDTTIVVDADLSPLAAGAVVVIAGIIHTVTAWDANAFEIDIEPALGAALAAGSSVELRKNTLPVASGAGFAVGDRVTLDAEDYTLAAVAPDTLALDRPPGILSRPNRQRLRAGSSVRKLRRANPGVPGGATTVAADTPPADPQTLVVADDIGAAIAISAAVSIDHEIYGVSGFDAATKTLTLDRELVREAKAGAAVEVRTSTLSAWGGRNLYAGAIAEIDGVGHKDRVVITAVTGDVLTLSAPINGYYEGQKLRVVEAEVIVESRDPATGAVLTSEAFTNLRLNDDKTPSYLVNQINTNSKLVTVQTLPQYSEVDLNGFPTAQSGAWQQFGGGDDAWSSLSVDDFVGEDLGSNKRTGIAALEDIDEIALCMAPNMWSPTVQAGLISHCELLKDRFAILDPRSGLSIEEVRTARETIDTKYAALYHPWLRVRNPREKKTVIVAPSGHIAGIYARVDVERGVHKAPANEVVRGIDLRQGLEQDVTKREQDLLNPKGINALRFFSGRGYRVWGARTLSSDASWKYVNVRRLFIMIEESIDEGTQWAVFEPNDRPLWARVRQTVVNFLTTQWRNGALQGKTAEEAFFVRCDESTMTQDDIDNGRLICQIGIAPVKPAEFVIFRIEQKTRELTT